MKTSFDISEPLLRGVKQLAKRRGITTKSLVEQALLKLLDDAEQTKPFKLRDLSVPGDGPTPEFENVSWSDIRGEIYPAPEPLRPGK